MTLRAMLQAHIGGVDQAPRGVGLVARGARGGSYDEATPPMIMRAFWANAR